jgi:hypothetical protein
MYPGSWSMNAALTENPYRNTTSKWPIYSIQNQHYVNDEQVHVSGNAPDFCFGGEWFKSQKGH